MEHLCRGRRGLDQFEWPLHSQDQTRSVWRESDANLRLRTGTRSCGMALSHCTRIEAPHVRLVECCGCCSFCDCSASKMQFFSAPATPLAVRCRHLRITISSATVVVACVCLFNYGCGSVRRKRSNSTAVAEADEDGPAHVFLHQ